MKSAGLNVVLYHHSRNRLQHNAQGIGQDQPTRACVDHRAPVRQPGSWECRSGVGGGRGRWATQQLLRISTDTKVTSRLMPRGQETHTHCQAEGGGRREVPVPLENSRRRNPGSGGTQSDMYCVTSSTMQIGQINTHVGIPGQHLETRSAPLPSLFIDIRVETSPLCVCVCVCVCVCTNPLCAIFVYLSWHGKTQTYWFGCHLDSV